MQEKNSLPNSPDEIQNLELISQQLRDRVGDFCPDILVVLGSGLGTVSADLQILAEFPYGSLHGLLAPTVAGHSGKLQLGWWGQRAVVVFQGRRHFYEGNGWEWVTLPVRLGHYLGAKCCLLTNMSGALNPKLAPGDLMVIDDHINFMGSNPLVGETAGSATNRFPDMQQAYSPRLRRLFDQASAELGIALAHGVYVAVSGPNYETPAEVRALRLLGGDVVGMSTVGEVLMARQLGIECGGISCIANMAAGICNQPLHHNDVLATAQSASLRLGSLLNLVLPRL